MLLLLLLSFYWCIRLHSILAPQPVASTSSPYYIGCVQISFQIFVLQIDGVRRNSKYSKLRIQIAHQRTPHRLHSSSTTIDTPNMLPVVKIRPGDAYTRSHLDDRIVHESWNHGESIIFLWIACLSYRIFDVPCVWRGEHWQIMYFLLLHCSLASSQLSIKFNKNLYSISYSIFRFNIYSRKCAIIFCSNCKVANVHFSEGHISHWTLRKASCRSVGRVGGKYRRMKIDYTYM